MEILINILKRETVSLKEQYIQKTKEWSEANYNLAVVRNKWTPENWCGYFGLTPEVRNQGTRTEFLGFPRGFYNTKQSKEHARLYKEYEKIVKLGLEAYLAKQVQYAEEHYETSINKLAFRISGKRLDINNLQVTTSHIGVNINTVLTDGVKTVKAFTIIASGDIQRPHYRYLIK